MNQKLVKMLLAVATVLLVAVIAMCIFIPKGNVDTSRPSKTVSLETEASTTTESTAPEEPTTEETFPAETEPEKLNPETARILELVNKELTSPLTINTDVSKYVILGDYKGLPLRKEVPEEVKESSVNLQLELSLLYYRHETDGIVEWHDALNINCIGIIDGKEEPLITYKDEEGYEFPIGNGFYPLPNCGEDFVGRKIGETFEFEYDYPDDCHYAVLRGKHAKFTVTINYRYVLDEYEPTDANIARVTNGEYKTVAAYKAAIRKSLEESEQSRASLTADRTEMMDLIIENATFLKLPAEELDYRYSKELHRMQESAESRGRTLEEQIAFEYDSLDGFVEKMGQKAADDTKIKLVLIAIAQAEGMATMTGEALDEHIRDSINGSPPPTFEWVKADIVENGSLEWHRTFYILEDVHTWLSYQ